MTTHGDGSSVPPKRAAGPGVRLGDRYEIAALLGSGGMGSVFSAHDTALDRTVALKLLPTPKWRDPKASSRLLREARAMARIAGDGVPQVFDHGVDMAFGPYVVMERLEGEDLSRFLHTRGPVAIALALAFMEQVCATLEAAHARGIVHRDLKPANLFVCPAIAAGRPRVKILDFGLAKAAGDDTGLTQPGDLVGTYAYMPPEAWARGSESDVRIDVYSLAATLYEMLAGEPPFRAATRAELQLSIANDPPPPLMLRRPDVPMRVTRAIDRAMSKAPSARFASVRAFAEALGVLLATPSSRTISGQVRAAFVGTARYRVARVLAEGRDTVVYAGHDDERGRPVALKRVRASDAEAAARLRREYRIASEVRSPNLVRIDDLVETRDDLVLVMELIEGEPLLDYLAGSESRVRACLAQLVGALTALHQRSLAHSDVKPQNIVVEPTGRLVLLDFGLVSPWGTRCTAQGTTAYVAPEALEGTVGPESDLYAVGVILHQALTGRLPATNGKTRTSRPPPARKRRPGDDDPAASATLRALCVRLLDASPTTRATAADVLAALGAAPGRALVPDGFVGRRDALTALSDAYAAASSGTAAVVWVEGASGIGKTTLLERFRRTLEEGSRPLILRGRAREETSTPFPALDEVIDELAAHLNRLPPAIAELVLPKRDLGLAKLFPVLTRVPAIARAKDPSGGGDDPARRHRKASDALRALLYRLGQHTPVVLIIDDLQWLDHDSGALLAHLLGGPEPAISLFVAAVRTEDGQGDALAIETLEAKLAIPVLRVRLEPLTLDESRELLRERWRQSTPLDLATVDRLARDSGGNPFLVDLLAAGPGSRLGGADALEDAVLEQYRSLDGKARESLELLCVSTRPVNVELLMSAVHATDPSALDALRSDSLVRVMRSDDGWMMEPRHGAIREAVCKALEPATRRSRHRQLADQLRADPDVDPEILVEHLSGCGDAASAGQVALQAAEVANRHLAFDRAASLFAVAIACASDDADRAALAQAQAQALQNAGRRRKAGEVLLEAAAAMPEGALKQGLRREAAGHLLLSGAIQAGLTVLAPTLAAAGIHLPEDVAEGITVTQRAVMALATRGFQPATGEPRGVDGESSDREALLETIDLLLLLSRGLAIVDLRALPLACLALHAALDVGEPRRLMHACAVFVIAAAGHVPESLIDAPLALCEELTATTTDPYARAVLGAARAQRAHFKGDFLAAESGFERAERILLESCVGATRELAMVRDMAVFIQYAHKGDFRSQLDRTLRWLAEANALKDPFHTSMLRVAHAIVWIAHDQPERARTELRRAEREGNALGGTLDVVVALYEDIAERYEASDDVRARESSRGDLLRLHAEHTPFLSGYVLLHDTWWALREAAAGHLDGGSRAPASIANLRGFGMEVWTAVADALEANWVHLKGDREGALRCAEAAEQGFRRLHMLCLAACARKRRGQFVAGALGARLEDEADADLRQLGVVDVERWTRAYWSMYQVSAVSMATRDSMATLD